MMEDITKMFKNGHPYEEILEYLRVHHDISISLSTFKRWLRENNIRRRPLQGVRAAHAMVVAAVQEELYGSGSRIGYRRVHRTLTAKGILCRRDDVRKIIKTLDPEGVQLRKRRRLHRRKYHAMGPNYVWHIDGHDKLKPYGFSIHACIDGFSRKLIWLEVGSSNKLPEVIAKYYLTAVLEFGGAPQKLKADDGTEHALIEPIHIYLSNLVRDDNECFSIITSTRNQRIESYWSILQRDRIGWWRHFFRDLLDTDLIDITDPVILDCIRFCFMPLVRQELNSIKDDWNGHLISKSRNGGPSGRPDTMYTLPHLYSVENCLVEVDESDAREFLPVVVVDSPDFSPQFKEFAEQIMAEDGLHSPSNPTEATQLYLHLLEQYDFDLEI